MIKVLLVDDHDLVRAAIRYLLEDVTDIKVIAQSKSGEEAIRLAKTLIPHVVLMDMQMPGMGGLEATRKMIRHNPDLKVLVLTVCDNEIHASRFLQTGAAGYITKGCGVDEMISAIRKVNAGQRYISPVIAHKLALKRVSKDEESALDILSERELQIMSMITSAQSVQEISDTLSLSPKTVNSYRYRIFEKLEIGSNVELTLLAIRLKIAEHN